MSVPPVKLTLATSGWRTMASPTVRPGPGRIETSPGGSPASVSSRPRASEVSGVQSAGLRRTAFPAARAGASFWASEAIGEFQGAMAPTTPRGSWVAKVVQGPREGVMASSAVSSSAAA